METPIPAQQGSSEESRNDFDESISDITVSQLESNETFFCTECKQATPCPRFVVDIRSRTRHSSLAVPGRFWELHGNMLESDELQLMGPNQAICMVKAKRTYDGEEKKLSVVLDSGWNAFRVANKFGIGDVLEFFLVGSSCFRVDLVLHSLIKQY